MISKKCFKDVSPCASGSFIASFLGKCGVQECAKKKKTTPMFSNRYDATLINFPKSFRIK